MSSESVESLSSTPFPITRLPPELIHHILSSFTHTDWPTLHSLALTSRRLHPFAISRLYSTLLDSPEGRTWGICHAARKNHPKLLDYLLERGVDVDSSLPSGRIYQLRFPHGSALDQVHELASPLYLAAKEGHEGIVAALLKKSASLGLAAPFAPVPVVEDDDGEEMQDDVDIFSRLSRPHILSPLHAAVHFGHFNIVEKLLQAGADVNSLARAPVRIDYPLVPPLILAALYHRSEIVEQLLRWGADPAVVGNWVAGPLHAIMDGVRSGPPRGSTTDSSPPGRPFTPAMKACIDMFLARNYSLSTPDHGRTCFDKYLYRYRFSPADASWFLARGIALDTPTGPAGARHFFRATMQCVEKAPGKREAYILQIWDWLVSVGADVHTTLRYTRRRGAAPGVTSDDHYEETLLHLVCGSSSIPKLRELLPSPTLARWLLAHGVDPGRKDSHGRRCYELVSECLPGKEEKGLAVLNVLEEECAGREDVEIDREVIWRLREGLLKEGGTGKRGDVERHRFHSWGMFAAV